MIRRILFCGTIIALCLILLGCASTTPAALPPAQPTTAAAGVPVAASSPAPLPPQPTSPSLAPRTPTPWQSPTPAVSVKGPEVARPSSGATTAATTAPTAAQPTATKAATVAQPTSGAASSVPTAPGVATGKRSEVKFAFLTPLTPQEEAEPLEMAPLRTELQKVPGFLDMSGDENAVTVGYDAGLVTVEQLMSSFAQLKHPVKRI